MLVLLVGLMYGSISSINNINISRVLGVAYPIHTQMIGYGVNRYEVKKNISRNERVTKSNKHNRHIINSSYITDYSISDNVDGSKGFIY